MNRYFYILLSYLLIISCNQSPSQTERDYIKNLEEKNKILEKELQDEKSKSKSTNVTQTPKAEKKSHKNYFTIGSTEEEVIEIMGNPTSYFVTAPEAKRFFFGLSSVAFYKGKVLSYDNLDGKLKVSLKK